jgi:hypothetical protein
MYVRGGISGFCVRIVIPSDEVAAATEESRDLLFPTFATRSSLP